MILLVPGDLSTGFDENHSQSDSSDSEYVPSSGDDSESDLDTDLDIDSNDSDNEYPLLVDDSPGDGERIAETLDQNDANDDHGRIPTDTNHSTSKEDVCCLESKNE